MSGDTFTLFLPQYAAEAEQVRRTLSTAGLPRPDGLYWHLKHDCWSAVVRYTLYLVTRASDQPGGRAYRRVATWELDHLPAERQKYPAKPVKTGGKLVEIGAHHPNSATRRTVVVWVDEHGLPVPVPPQWYEAITKGNQP